MIFGFFMMKFKVWGKTLRLSGILFFPLLPHQHLFLPICYHTLSHIFLTRRYLPLYTVLTINFFSQMKRVYLQKTDQNSSNLSLPLLTPCLITSSFPSNLMRMNLSVLKPKRRVVLRWTVTTKIEIQATRRRTFVWEIDAIVPTLLENIGD